jgi:hypothetical protein
MNKITRRRKCRPIEDRFWYRVHKTDTCWLWTGAKHPGGYGQFPLYPIGPDMVPTGRPTNTRASRVSWILHKGPIPEGMWVLHKCDTPSCVNPEHLFLGTAATNTADCVSKKRNAVGITNGHSKLTEQQVRDIRLKAKNGSSQSSLCREYSLSPGAICMIISRKRWSHIS